MVDRRYVRPIADRTFITVTSLVVKGQAAFGLSSNAGPRGLGVAVAIV
jgi:hypothetical protein